MDLETLKSKVDLTMLQPECSYMQVRRTCNRVVNKGYRSACIPSKYLFVNREYFPNLKISTVVNYPQQLHSCDVVLREIQGIVGICDDISQIEIDVVCPPLFSVNLDLFAQWNYLVPLKLIIPWNNFVDYIKLLPHKNESKHPPFSMVGFIRPSSLSYREDILATITKKYIDLIKEKGYTTKVSGYFRDIEDLLSVEKQGVECFGISNIFLLEEKKYGEGHSNTSMQDISDSDYI